VCANCADSAFLPSAAVVAPFAALAPANAGARRASAGAHASTQLLESRLLRRQRCRQRTLGRANRGSREPDGGSQGGCGSCLVAARDALVVCLSRHEASLGKRRARYAMKRARRA
jgi:hypothetical protein